MSLRKPERGHERERANHRLLMENRFETTAVGGPSHNRAAPLPTHHPQTPATRTPVIFPN